MPTARLTWNDLNSGALQEDEIRIYRDTAPFDSDSLPAVFATLDPDTEFFDDDTVEESETYYYAVAMVRGPILAISFGDIEMSAAVMSLDSRKSSPQLTFSSGNLVLTSSTSKGTYGAKTKYSRKTGKHYFEVTVTKRITIGGTSYSTVGLMRPDQDFELQSVSALGVWCSLSSNINGDMYVNAAFVVNLGAPSDGDRYGFAVDFGAGLVWARRNNGSWNGSGTADPATGTGGFTLGDMIGRDIGPASTVTSLTESHAYRFAAGSWIDTAPSGFTEWPIDVTGDNSGLGTAVLDSVRNNATMSGGNLTATRGVPSPAAARSRDYKGAGRYYMEFTPTSWGGSGDCVGLVGANGTTANIVSNGSNGVYVYRSGGAVWVNNAASAVSLGTISNGQRIDVAVDLSLRRIWFRKDGGNWNNSGTADPATDAEGLDFNPIALSPCIGLGGTSSNSAHNVTANLGGSSFGGTPPAGFVSGWPVQGALAEAEHMWVGAIE